MIGPAEKKRTAAPTEKKKPRKKRKGNPWVENIESLVIAVVLALIIRTFVVEAFVIPTGSMALSLYGNHFNVKCPNCGYKYALGFNPPDSRIVPERVRCVNCGAMASAVPAYERGMPIPGHAGGDRILVNKILYKFREPDRWDPFVFVNPNVRAEDRRPYKTTYIKRLVGLPGETLEIVRGDVVVDGTIQRKPADAQSRLWMPVYDINYEWTEGHPWKPTGNAWSLEGRRLVANGSNGGLAWVTYMGGKGRKGDVIRDDYGYDQDLTVENASYLGRGAGLNVVTDVRVSFDVKTPGSGRLVLSLLCDDADDRAEIDFASRRATLTRSGRELASTELPAFSNAGTHHLEFYRLDYLLVLAVDGERAVEYDLWDPEAYRRWSERGRNFADHVRRMRDMARQRDDTLALDGYKTSGVKLGADGSCELTNLKIHRDVYYTFKPKPETKPRHYAGPWKIPEDCYFALGDNSPESLDSRYWKDEDTTRNTSWVPADHLIGKALVIWWHPRRIRLIH